jgi:hypothetical protein
MQTTPATMCSDQCFRCEQCKVALRSASERSYSGLQSSGELDAEARSILASQSRREW